MSAPPTSVTGVHEPEKVWHVPFESVAESRSTTPLPLAMPDPPSVPLPSVSGTDALVYHGPPLSDALWPLGAVESGVIVTESVAVVEAPLVAVTFFAPGLPVAPAVQL